MTRTVGRQAAWLLGAAVIAVAGIAVADARLSEVVALVDAGRFAEAEARIVAELAAGPRAALEFERERMRRIRLDFSLDEASLRARLQARIPTATDADRARWVASGTLERMLIDGKPYYFKGALNNLLRLEPEAAARAVPPFVDSDGPLYAAHPLHAELLDEARRSDANSVAPRRLRVRHTLTLAADAVPDGEVVRAWIPYPRAIAGQQQDLELLGSEPAGAQLAPESALQRTAYLERAARAGLPTVFTIEYAVTTRAQVHLLDPSRATRGPLPPEAQAELAERPPHIVFSEPLRRFSRKVVGEERNPVEIARRLFAAVDRIPWAVAREYSTISDLGAHALAAGHADCGQQTLLLITLLRMNGIPARWQSGWQFSPTDFDTMHDWGALYLAPWGWVPMDVTHGRLQSADPAIEWFYLGSLDGYRIAFNDDWGRPFVPARQHPRSETVDSQRGELEWRGGNLYFDTWDYELSWQLLPAG